MNAVQLGPSACRYCKNPLPITGTETIDVDGTPVIVRKAGRPRVQCGSDECTRAMRRESAFRTRARKAMAS